MDRILQSSATRLLSEMDTPVDMVILDPPSRLGVGDSEDDPPVEEMMSALFPVAEQSYRILRPGGVVVFIGESQQMSAWELAAGWQGFAGGSEVFILWDGVGESGIPSMVTTIRWYVKPGNRFLSFRSVDLGSNVLSCHRVPLEDRISPFQLPVELFNFLISVFSLPRGAVVDPFCGTGSALVAAEMCGRKWLGGDIDPGMVAAAGRRVKQVELEESYLRPIQLVVGHGRLCPIGG